MTRLFNRYSTAIVAILIAWAFGVANASAQTGAFSFATTPGKLPKTVVPLHYAIDLVPDLDGLSVAGSEVVEIDVMAPTDRLVLNAVNMAVSSATIEGEAQPATIASDAKAETVTLTFAHALGAGRHTLRIVFDGHINSFGRGLFYVDYPVADGKKRMISSQLEPSEARRIFPSWDEPAFKAAITLSVTVPEQFLAVGNMPVAQEQPAGGGRKRVTFQPTPKMSTYLFVLVAGELERLTSDAGGITVGVVTTRGKSATGRYAIETATELLKYYNDYFGIKYPLPKLDLIAVPGGFGGAMENWGGITFFESRLLFDSDKSARELQRSIFGIIAHEMAHLWFGDLVTTAWWNDIWLNEGFASWMASKAADHLHPEWQTWLNSGFKQTAMAEDARSTSHPIEQPVEDETAAMALFDSITYSKGQAVLRMIEAYLGESGFRDGIRRYMQAHAYSNATTADLWRALEDASGVAVANVAVGFTQQKGVPLIVAETKCVQGEQRVLLRQERFTIHDPDAQLQRWNVPVVLGAVGTSRAPKAFVLDGSFDADAGPCGETVKLNLGDVGYYRVQYDAAMQAALTRSVATLAPADRINFLSDTWALIQAERIMPATYFDVVNRLAADDNRAVWDQIMRTFGQIDYLARGRAGREAFQAYARRILRLAFDRLGWQPRTDETAVEVQLRARLIRELGDLGDMEILAEAKRRFAAFLNDASSLSQDLRDPVVHLAGRVADRTTYDTLIALGRKSTSTEERVRYYSAAAGALDENFAKETLAIAVTDELPASMTATLINWVAAEHRELALAFARANYAALAGRQGPAFANTFMAGLMSNFSDRAHADELANFAPSQATSGGRIIAARAREHILANADFIERQMPAIDDWLARNRP